VSESMTILVAAVAGLAAVGVTSAEPYWRGREVSPGPVLCRKPAAEGVKVVCDRWPDGSDLRRFGLDAIRLSGAKTEQEKAIAIWRWVRRWTMYTDGNVPTEKALKRSYIDDPVKVLNVYGTQWCDGLSRVMEAVWRSLGGRAEKLYRGGHTMCNVYWKDTDGVGRWHLFDVSEGGYMYHSSRKRLLSPDEMSTDIYNYMATWIHCAHLPWPAHRVELSFRQGERLDRLWGQEGKPYQENVRYDHQTVPESERGPYKIGYGNGRLTYAVPLDGTWREGLVAEPVNVTCRENGLQPEIAGKPASAVWRIRSPYIIARAAVELEGRRASKADTIRLLLSVDEGTTWTPVWEAAQVGRAASGPVDICPTYTVTMKAPRPRGVVSPFGRYAYRVKLEIQAKGKPADVSVSRLAFHTVVQHNVYALPQLHPGRNRITVMGNLDPKSALEITYLWDDLTDQGRRNVTIIEDTPCTYEILADGKRWNDVVCRSLSVRAIQRTGIGTRTTVKEAPCTVRALPPMSHPDTTRARWRRPIEAPLRSVEEYVAELAKDGNVRGATQALNDLADPKAFDALKKAVYQKRWRGEKERAMVALYVTDPKRALPVLLDILNHPEKARWKEDPKNPAVKTGHWCGAAAVIGMIMAKEGCMEAVPGLIKVLECPDGWRDARWSVLRTLGRLGDARAGDAVRKHLHARNGDTVMMAALAAGQVGDRDAIPRLRQLLRSGFELNRQHAALSLGLLGDAASAPAIRTMLSHRDENLRAAAAEALGHLSDRESLPLLKRMAEDDPFPWVRERARSAIGQ